MKKHPSLEKCAYEEKARQLAEALGAPRRRERFSDWGGAGQWTESHQRGDRG